MEQATERAPMNDPLIAAATIRQERAEAEISRRQTKADEIEQGFKSSMSQAQMAFTRLANEAYCFDIHDLTRPPSAPAINRLAEYVVSFLDEAQTFVLDLAKLNDKSEGG